jgi:isoleucyl-tRNA synthetase
MNEPKKSQFSQIEEEVIKLWNKEKTFEKSLELRKGAKRFRFYDGPPFTSGPPHYGHVEQSALKDAVARYKTMRGYYVPRRTGADTHGLPVENLVEKEHGFKTKKDIVAFGVGKFNQACRAVVFRHKDDFNEMYQRLGRWDDPEHSYATLDRNYMESVWWVFSELYKKGLIYKSLKSLPYCPRCATPLSNFEVNDGYKHDVPDPSVYAKFTLVDEPNTSLLAWTTTPWTLPANAALAVDTKADYAIVELLSDGDGWKKGEKLILAKKRLELLDVRKSEYKVIDTEKGKALVGVRYEPLYKLTELTPEQEQTANRIYADEAVSLDDGTGVLHIAPHYGETDLNLGLREKLPLIESVDNTGHMNRSMGPFKGMYFKDADEHIIADLTRKGRIFAAETFTHTYPFCWRCETPLLYYAMPSWFVAVTKFRDELVAAGRATDWVPSHVKSGRFVKWLEGARDWAISRNRFWGAPIPIWVNVDDDNDLIVVGSLAELRQLTGAKSEIDMHRPGIDRLVIKKDGKTYRRVEEVLDCWFESGSMPYGQDHYPFENKDDFEASFPADFVCEAIEQVHLWFYTLHVLSVALFNKPAYQNVVATGLILGADGLKLSKRLRNYPPVEKVFTEFGADTLRFFLLESPLMSAGDTRLSQDALRDVQRNVFMTLWNTYKFFKLYADIDRWSPSPKLQAPNSKNVLDLWIIERLKATVAEVTDQADNYQIPRAVRPIRELIDDLSNWYVRRSRRRFWKSKNDNDKAYAYATLHHTLIRLCQLLAPWSPFMADYIYRDLTRKTDMPASVHLTDWPEPEKLDETVLASMQLAREAINEALAQRAEAKIKVRQPLSKVVIGTTENLPDSLTDIIAEELNVKSVIVKKAAKRSVQLDTELTDELYSEGMARDVVRLIQSDRKAAGLSVSDRISLSLFSLSPALRAAIDLHTGYIAAETLAAGLEWTDRPLDGTGAFSHQLDDKDLTLRIKKI